MNDSLSNWGQSRLITKIKFGHPGESIDSDHEVELLISNDIILYKSQVLRLVGDIPSSG